MSITLAMGESVDDFYRNDTPDRIERYDAFTQYALMKLTVELARPEMCNDLIPERIVLPTRGCFNLIYIRQPVRDNQRWWLVELERT